MLDEYPDGVWFVELAPLGDPTLVAGRGQSPRRQEQSGKDLVETVAEWLVSRRLLLLLDNAEHLLEACARLADALLRRCAGLVILVTSRERLGIEGELTYRVPSLLSRRRGRTRRATTYWPSRRRACSSSAPGCNRPDFDVTAKDARRWPRSAAAWTASRWPSSWRRRGCA